MDAIYIGHMSDGAGGMLPLYNITKAGHPQQNSSVSAETLRQLGLEVPPPFKSVDDLIAQADAARSAAVRWMLQHAYFIVKTTGIKRGAAGMRPALARLWGQGGNVRCWAFVESFEVLRHKGMI